MSKKAKSKKPTTKRVERVSRGTLAKKKTPAKKKVAKKKAKAAPVRKTTAAMRKTGTATAKPKIGRPSRYQTKFATELPEMFKNGESVAEVCVALGIHKDTFYEWVKNKPEFSDAYKKGQEFSEAWWNKIGRANATGRMRGSAATWIFNMKNRFGWKDRTEVESTVNIKESGIGVDDDMDEEEWNEAAARQQAIMKGLV